MRSFDPENATAVIAPTKLEEAVISWAFAASSLEKPDFSRIAKSPTSCGTCKKIILTEI